MFSFIALSFPHFLASLYVSGAITAIKLLSSMLLMCQGAVQPLCPMAGQKWVVKRHWHLPQSRPLAWIPVGVHARQWRHLLDIDPQEEKALFLLQLKDTFCCIYICTNFTSCS